MPRRRTGTLVPPGADGMWRARVTRPDGSRPLYSLGTTDKALARRKLARLVEAIDAGHDMLDAADVAGRPERVKEYAEGWLVKRETQGVASVRDERGWLDRHVLGAIGHLPLCDVRPSHVRGILDDALARGLRRNSLANLRGVLHRLFRAALEVEHIEHNPVAAVRVPKMHEVRKERCILTDAEFSRFVACAAVDLELRMLALVARCEGGMRTGDLKRWDWAQIDRVDFAECTVPRAKTGRPQALAIPDLLAPFLRGWWERAGEPASGPVFPRRRDDFVRRRRAGDFRESGGSFARQLRRELFRAGVYRMPPVEVPATSPGTRTDRGKRAEGMKRAPSPADPLYYETEATLPVDFHSFRRAFNTALAEAGVNVQHAMHLAAHSDPKVHARYVMSTRAMRTIPAAALPALPVAVLAEAPKSSRRSMEKMARNVTGHDDSISVTIQNSMISEVRTGFEPAYNGFANRCLTTWLPHRREPLAHFLAHLRKAEPGFGTPRGSNRQGDRGCPGPASGRSVPPARAG